MPSQMIVKVDKEDWVVEVTREDSDMAEIHRSEQVQPTTRLCKGPWHYKGGTGTMVDIREFSTNFRTHDLNKTCNACLKGSHQSKKQETPQTGLTRVEKALEAAGVENGTLAKLEANSTYGKAASEKLPQWRVTIVKRTEELVYARDFLDAAAQAGDGEVLKVERID